MQLVVEVTAELADALRSAWPSDAPPDLAPEDAPRAVPSADAQALLSTARQHGLELAFQHPDTRDAELSRFLTARVADAQSGEQAAGALRAVPGVVRAFVKPQPSPAHIAEER